MFRNFIIHQIFCEFLQPPKDFRTCATESVNNIPTERLSIPSRTGWGRSDTGRLATSEFPLRIDSASWKSCESLIQFNLILQIPVLLPISSNTVSWSSTNLLLAKVSKMELWKFFNSSISLRLFWASRNSEFLIINCAWRSCWSRRWRSSAWAQWSSSCWDSTVSLNFCALLRS